MAKSMLTQQAREDYDFRSEHFKFVQKIVHDRAGIVLSEVKRDMVYGRLVRRLRALKIDTFDEYMRLIRKDNSNESVEFINSITTNLTSFFRENHHFEFLKNKAFPEFVKDNKKRIRIWSAGCSTGEEPYSLAITAANLASKLYGMDVRILATDLDSQVVKTAQEGLYNEDRVQGIPKNIVNKWFNIINDQSGKMVQVVPQLQEYIQFNQLNLMNEWPMKGKFDVIFCRNVVIYFDKDTQRTLFDRYANYLNPNGYLIVGHSESLHGVTTRFELLGKTIYQKKS